MPTALHWIADAPYGRLAIMPRPRAGEWLADELTSWKSCGVDVVVSLLAESEVADLDLQHEPALCRELGLTYISYPIADRNVPDSLNDFLLLADRLNDDLQANRGVAAHCRMGIGRSSLVAACLLVKSGLSPASAFACISRARGLTVPDTKDQIEWVASIAGRLRTGTSAT